MFDIYKTTKASGTWERARAVLIGVTLFFPAFLLSLPVTMLWANHLYAGEAQGALAGIGISFWFGTGVAILACIYLVCRVNRELRDTER